MNTEEILQVAKIDQQNMSKFFAKIGREFDIELRMSKIESEISEGAKFFLAKEKGKVIGYAEYIERENNRVTIKSIQVVPEKMNGFTLLKIIRGIYPDFKDLFANHTIISATHHDNVKSKTLHKRLGFIETEVEEDRVTFACDGVEFISKIERYIK